LVPRRSYIPAGSELSGDRWTVTLQGKVIGITGTIEPYQGKPEIKVMSMSQIKEADSQPVAQ
jgi:DNA/RNA endonuclease YhcR with UshA esterase domain